MPAHMESAVGIFRALMEDHLPLDILIEPDVKNPATLAQYKVLILPNAACLSERALADDPGVCQGGRGPGRDARELTLQRVRRPPRRFRSGRRLWCCTSKEPKTFQLAGRIIREWTEVYVGIKKPDLHPITDDAVIRSNYRRGSDRLQYIGWMTNVEAATGAVKLGRRLSVPKEWPFIVLNQPATGRSVYFAEDIGQAYFIAPYQYQRKLISNAVQWAARSNQPPARVNAPLCVQAAYYQQQGGKRTIVHLLNEVNTSANRALPENNPSQREETLPILDITVGVTDLNVTRAILEPGHHPLVSRKTASGVEVTVPRLDIHAMLVFE